MSLLREWFEDYRDLWLNFKFEMIKNIRQKRILIVSIIAISLPLLFYLVPLFSDKGLPETVNEFLPSIMSFTNLVIVLNAIFFGADAINTERYNKTALLIYPLPQRRTAIFFGKYLAQLFTSWVMIGLYYLTSTTIIIAEYGIESITIDMLKSIIFASIYMTAMLSIAFFLSSIMRNPAASMMFTFFIIFMLFPIISMLMGSIDVDTSNIITNYSGFINKIFRFPSESFGPPTLADDLTIEKGIQLSLIYSFVLTTFAWLFNNKQEI